MVAGRQSLRMGVTGLAVLLMGAGYGWAWGNDGHQIVARIASLNLSPKARRHVAQLLGVSSGPTSVANAMARAAVWPDTFLRNHAPKSKPWHFIDICRGADASDLGPFCPAGGCITKKIEEYRANIPQGQFDEFGRNVEGAAWGLRQKCGWFGRMASHCPCHVGRVYVVQRQRPRGLAPAVEIGFAFEGDGGH